MIRDFFNNKKNLIMAILLGVSLIAVIIAYFWSAFMPVSCILFGACSIYASYLFLLKFTAMKKNKIEEFVSEDNKLKRQTSKFLDNESKINVMFLSGVFFIMGILLIYYAIRTFTL